MYYDFMDSHVAIALPGGMHGRWRLALDRRFIPAWALLYWRSMVLAASEYFVHALCVLYRIQSNFLEKNWDVVLFIASRCPVTIHFLATWLIHEAVRITEPQSNKTFCHGHGDSTHTLENVPGELRCQVNCNSESQTAFPTICLHSNRQRAKHLRVLESLGRP
jgi:hypothetical protein